MLRRLVLAIVVWLAAVPALGAERLPPTRLDFGGQPGNSQTGASLLAECSPKGEQGAGPYGRDVKCKSAVGAVVDALDAAATLAPLGRVYCPPGGSLHWLEAADAFVAWAREHPDQMRVPAGFLVVEALRQRWPCSERGM